VDAAPVAEFVAAARARCGWARDDSALVARPAVDFRADSVELPADSSPNAERAAARVDDSPRGGWPRGDWVVAAWGDSPVHSAAPVDSFPDDSRAETAAQGERAAWEQRRRAAHYSAPTDFPDGSVAERAVPDALRPREDGRLPELPVCRAARLSLPDAQPPQDGWPPTAA